MDRIATNSLYSTFLNNLFQAEAAQTQATTQLSTGQVATDLKGFGGATETLLALQNTQTSVTAFANQNQIVGDKLVAQDTALNQVASAADGAGAAIRGAIASGDGTTLMQSLQNELQNAVQGLNTTFNGQYLFSGGQVNTPATSAANLTDLTAAPSIASLFNNDQHVATNQINGQTAIQSGFLASNVATPLYTALQAIEAYAQGPNGPFNGPLTVAQAAFLQSTLAGLTTVHSNLDNVVGQNGLLQAQVTNATTDLTNQQTQLQGMLGGITDANMAQAATNLQQAQLAIQAAGQVFVALRSTTLLNTLSTTG
ncbi:MAG: flagellin [Caulobacterales bacterium]